MSEQLGNIPDTLVGLVSHYSPSGQERGAVEWLTKRMKTVGYTDSFIDGAGNAVGLMGNGPHQVLLLGHIDTVPGEIPICVEDGVLYGRGAVDAKGPLACFTDSVARVGVQDGWQFVVIGAVEEERNSEGARFIVDKYRPDFLLVGEPNRWDRVGLAYKGNAWAEVTVRRTQAHTASGEETAAEAAVAAWLVIQSVAGSFNAGRERAFDKILPTLRKIEAGQDDFTQWARLSVGARLPVEIPPQAWYAQLTETLPGCDVERVGFAVPAWRCEKNTPLVRALLSGIRSQGGAPSFVYKTGTADLNIVAPLWQCPAAVYGPGDSALDHTPNEHVSIAEYWQSVEALSTALRALVNAV